MKLLPSERHREDSIEREIVDQKARSRDALARIERVLGRAAEMLPHDRAAITDEYVAAEELRRDR